MRNNKQLQLNRRVILIVDDEAVNREMLGFFFEENYNILYAENGQEALSILREKGSRISIVLLDINMPVMSGKELLKIMHADEVLQQIPVIVLTSDKNSELETLRIGAVDFIKKPYDMPEIIVARVERIIEFSEGKRIIRDVENDKLTGLYTERFFYEYSLLLIERDPDDKLDILALNLENFRMINEIYGKGFGDKVLITLADSIRDIVREIGGLACRRSGDTFYVLLRHQDNYDDIYQALISGLRELGKENNLRVRLRMGIFQNIDTSVHSMEWYTDAAKAASNLARGDYFNSIIIYDDSMHEKELYNERLISEIDRGIREKQFKVFFQPKFNIRGDSPYMSSAEALVRWIHPELGFISPGDFIPLFEKNGLIMKLDDYVCRETAAYIRKWRDKHGWAPPISVNLSRMDLYDLGLKDRLLSIARENGISVKDMLLEITESAFSQDEKRILETIDDLRAAGFMIEMDDFGSGYSSLNMLSIMPIDVLKIDMEFVKNIVRNKNGYRIVELVVEIGRTLEVPIIVEGVEYEDQYKLVKDAGCDIIQGYYFSKPLDSDTFEEKLQSEAEKLSITKGGK